MAKIDTVMQIVTAQCHHEQAAAVYLMGQAKCASCAIDILANLIDHGMKLERRTIVQRVPSRPIGNETLTCDHCGETANGRTPEGWVPGWTEVRFYREADCIDGVQMAPRHACSAKCLDRVVEREMT